MGKVAVGVALAIVGALPATAASVGASARHNVHDPRGGTGSVSDYNGDGYADLAISVDWEDLGRRKINAGAFHVLYGSVLGVRTAASQFVTQDSPGVVDNAENGDRFGKTLAPGDYNGDGYSDLAAAAAYEDLPGREMAGTVDVFYGSAGGLATDAQLWTQANAGVLEEVEADDEFGAALASGDLNGDGFDDLAVGVPGESVEGVLEAGAVNVLYGTASGLAAAGNQLWTQNLLQETAEEGDGFGKSLTAGDVNGDGFVDLVVGAQAEGVGTVLEAGSIHVILGSAAGLTEVGNQVWSEDSPGLGSVSEAGDWFGFALAPGDLNADGFDDVAIGVALKDVASLANAGVVQVLYGSITGLSAAGNQLWHQDVPEVLEVNEEANLYGFSLAADDFNGDGFGDLSVGVGNESVGGTGGAGAINILLGSALGLTAAGNQLWTQDSEGIDEQVEWDDYFGWTQSAGDANGDGFADVAVGVTWETVGSIDRAGAVNMILGSPSGLTSMGSQFITQDSPGVLDAAEPLDEFSGSPAGIFESGPNLRG